MGELSKIEWCDHTFNPWIGCTKVSPACDNCYAERDMDHRFGRVKWGAGQPRSLTNAQNWNKPLRWNREAEGASERPRVFCASLADVFDTEVDLQWRLDLFELIRETPHLDWLLLTKRPAEARKWFNTSDNHPAGLTMYENIWLGTTVENNQMAKARINHLLRTRNVSKRFLSMEPLLESVSLRHYLWADSNGYPRDPGIDWVIVGGESGPEDARREMAESWAQAILDECREAGVPFLLKQMTGGSYEQKQDIPEPIFVREYPAANP